MPNVSRFVLCIRVCFFMAYLTTLSVVQTLSMAQTQRTSYICVSHGRHYEEYPRMGCEAV